MIDVKKWIGRTIKIETIASFALSFSLVYDSVVLVHSEFVLSGFSGFSRKTPREGRKCVFVRMLTRKKSKTPSVFHVFVPFWQGAFENGLRV